MQELPKAADQEKSMMFIRNWPSVKIVEVLRRAYMGYPNVVQGECGHIILTNRTTTVRCLACFTARSSNG